MQVRRAFQFPTRAAAAEKDGAVPAEVGAVKEDTENIGYAGFGVSAAAAGVATVGEILELAGGATAVAGVVPGLNVGVAAFETFNAGKKLIQGDAVVAESHFGNAAGCLSTFLATAALGSTSYRNLLVGGAIGMGALGGVLGLVSGISEIRRGRELIKATGSHRTFQMGVLDIASGVTSLGGALATATVGPGLGLPLMLASNICDIAGIAADYLGNKQDPSKPKRTVSAHLRRHLIGHRGRSSRGSAPPPARRAGSVSPTAAH